jgi:hypothetical protein
MSWPFGQRSRRAGAAALVSSERKRNCCPFRFAGNVETAARGYILDAVLNPELLDTMSRIIY